MKPIKKPHPAHPAKPSHQPIVKDLWALWRVYDAWQAGTKPPAMTDAALAKRKALIARAAEALEGK